jgi:hypothetical protein
MASLREYLMHRFDDDDNSVNSDNIDENIGVSDGSDDGSLSEGTEETFNDNVAEAMNAQDKDYNHLINHPYLNGKELVGHVKLTANDIDGVKEINDKVDEIDKELPSLIEKTSRIKDTPTDDTDLTTKKYVDSKEIDGQAWTDEEIANIVNTAFL